ncbi:MAG: homoserine kinase [Thermoanaerobaculia bacterium]
MRAYAPATVSNVACGFDVLGFAIEEPGDEVIAELGPRPGVELREVTGDGGRLPRDPEKNTAGVAVRALLDAVGSDRGIVLRLRKNMPLASGLGSSAASGVAAVWAASRLLELDVPRDVLLRCAMAGEKVASGSAHPDNAAPCLYGGFVLIRQANPPDVIPLPVPEGLSCAVVRPHIEVNTRESRQLLGDSVPLRDAVTQWGNLGGLVAGLFKGDLELISRSLEDVVVEPKRSGLVPGFDAAKQAALDHGALGCSLSGSGPSTFALAADRDVAERAADAMVAAFAAEGLASDRLVSPVGADGVRILGDQ